MCVCVCIKTKTNVVDIQTDAQRCNFGCINLGAKQRLVRPQPLTQRNTRQARSIIVCVRVCSGMTGDGRVCSRVFGSVCIQGRLYMIGWLVSQSGRHGNRVNCYLRKCECIFKEKVQSLEAKLYMAAEFEEWFI